MVTFKPVLVLKFTKSLTFKWSGWYFFFNHTMYLAISFFIHQLMHKWTVLKTILKRTLKQLRHVSVQSHHHQGVHY
jgi:hypothetical protein